MLWTQNFLKIMSFLRISSVFIFNKSPFHTQATTDLSSVSIVTLPILEILCKWNHTNISFVLGFFLSPECFWNSFMLLHVSVFNDFLLLSGIPLYWHITLWLFFHHVKAVGFFSVFGYYEFCSYEHLGTSVFVWAYVFIYFSY